MQKQVSKQSLAVLALSILLAISMALTATFAAFSGQNTATATITFTESDITVTFAGWQGEGFNTLTLDNTDFEIVDAAAGTVKLTDAAIAKINALKVTVAGVPTGFNIRLDVTASGAEEIVTIVENDIANQATVSAVAPIAATAKPVAAASASGTLTVQVVATAVNA